MITINEPKVIATTQSYVFESVNIAKVFEKLEASVRFGIYNENNERIGEKVIIYSDEDYNTFWENFNSGKFLYTELKAKENLNVEVTDTVEDDFINTEVTNEI